MSLKTTRMIRIISHSVYMLRFMSFSAGHHFLRWYFNIRKCEAWVDIFNVMWGHFPALFVETEPGNINHHLFLTLSVFMTKSIRTEQCSHNISFLINHKKLKLQMYIAHTVKAAAHESSYNIMWYQCTDTDNVTDEPDPSVSKVRQRSYLLSKWTSSLDHLFPSSSSTFLSFLSSFCCCHFVFHLR